MSDSPLAPAPSPDLPLALVGCDFRVASSSWRSALVLDVDERRTLADRLAHAAGIRALAVVDTCNRTEWVVESPHPAWTSELLSSWMLRRWRASGVPDGELPRPYVHVGAAAVRHYVRVAVGLESFVPGEREIAGQCEKALQAARAEHLASPLLDELSKAAGRAVKKLERLGRFRDASRGVHALGVDLACMALDQSRPEGSCGARIGVAGIGVLGRKVAGVLEVRGARVTRFNRTLRSGSMARPLEDLPGLLAGLDALVACTGALSPVVRIPSLPGRSQPLVVVDLGVPSQVHVDDGAEGVLRLGLDDVLASTVEDADADDAALAREITEVAVTEVLLANARRTSAEMLRAAQTKRDELRDARLPALLDDVLPDLDLPRRKRLESSLRALMSEQHKTIVDEIERRAAGTLPPGTAPDPEPAPDHASPAP